MVGNFTKEEEPSCRAYSTENEVKRSGINFGVYLREVVGGYCNRTVKCNDSVP